MFESKDDIARDVLCTERVRTLLYLSMIKDIPISILYFENGGYIDQGEIKTGVVKVISPGVGPRRPFREYALNGKFCFVSDEDCWFDISMINAISFTKLNDPKSFYNHTNSLTNTHLQALVHEFGTKKGTIKLNQEFDDEINTKFYRILSSILSNG